MGIKQLMQLLTDKAPDSYKSITLDQLSGRTLAIDASIAIYQFLISTQFTFKNPNNNASLSVKQFTD
jgi:flap endonuclease-1